MLTQGASDGLVAFTLSNTHDIEIDWGDGSEVEYSSGDDSVFQRDFSHDYGASGTYSIKIHGPFTLNRWDFITLEGIDVISWGSSTLNVGGYFLKNTNFTSIPANDSPKFAYNFDGSFLFASIDTSHFRNIVDWDMTNMTDMEEIFDSAVYQGSYMALPLDLSGWNTSAVWNMKDAFAGASLFVSGIGSWDTSSATDMQGMFANASIKSNSPIDLSQWDTSSVTTMSYMFKDSYDSEPPYDIDFSSLNSWEVSNVQYMDYMFYKLIEGTPELSSWDVSNVTTMNSMFYWAREFNSDISNWNVSNVQDMQTMFLGASIFNQDISGWDTSSVIAMDRMFAGAEAFDQDLSSWDIRNVQSMDGMFSNATLSTANYDALLIGWEAQDVQNNVVFDGGYSKYSAGVAAEARQRLIDEHGWVITDGGQAP